MRYLILVFFLCLASCADVKKEDGIRYEEFKFKGHSYFKILDGCDYNIVHDPDCPCRNKKGPSHDEPQP